MFRRKTRPVSRKTTAKLFLAALIGATVAAPAVATGPAQAYESSLAPKGSVSFAALNFEDHYIRHRNFNGYITPVNTRDRLDVEDSSFWIRSGLDGNSDHISLESVNHPGYYLRHEHFRVKLSKYDKKMISTVRALEDASFKQSFDGEYTSFESVNFPDRYIRHSNFELRLDQDNRTEQFWSDASFVQHRH